MTEIVLDRESFTDAVAFAAKTLPRNAYTPTLNGLRLTATDAYLTVSSFDYDTYSSAQVPCDGPALDYLVPGAALVRYLSGMVDDRLSLTFGETHLDIACGRMTAILPRLSLDNYPSPPTEPPHIGTVEADLLVGALDDVRDCIDPDSPNAGRKGYVLLLGSPLIVAGIHPQRIAMREVLWTGKATDTKALVPVSSMDAARAFRGEVVVGHDEGRLSFADDTRQIITRLVQGQPDNFVPMFNLPAPVATVTFDRAEMVGALRWLTISDTRKEAHGGLSFDIGTDAVVLTLVGAETGAHTTVAAKVEGEQQVMGWLARNLISGLNATDADFVTLTAQQPKRPALITADDDPTLRYLAQPWSLA